MLLRSELPCPAAAALPVTPVIVMNLDVSHAIRIDAGAKTPQICEYNGNVWYSIPAFNVPGDGSNIARIFLVSNQ